MTTTTDGTLAVPFTFGTPQHFESLWLVPLFAAGEPRAGDLGLDEAAARGLVVREVDDAGEVNNLVVENPLDLPVLLYEGEELVGAKQNRILDGSTLVPAKARTVVSVSCVERGRWAYRSRSLKPAPRAAYPDLRRAKHEGAAQGEVWQSVAAKAARLDAHSPTEAAEEIYVSRAAPLEKFLAGLPRHHGQCGAVACIGGRVTCVDWVSRSDAWASLHVKLVRGYALDAIEPPRRTALPSRALAELIASLHRAPRFAAPAGTIGETRRIEDDSVVGTELAVDGEVRADRFPAGARWAAALARGEQPDPLALIREAGDGADELARMVDRYLRARPRGDPGPETVDVARAWIAGDAPLVQLRMRRGVRND